MHCLLLHLLLRAGNLQAWPNAVQTKGGEELQLPLAEDLLCVCPPWAARALPACLYLLLRPALRASIVCHLLWTQKLKFRGKKQFAPGHQLKWAGLRFKAKSLRSQNTLQHRLPCWDLKWKEINWMVFHVWIPNFLSSLIAAFCMKGYLKEARERGFIISIGKGRERCNPGAEGGCHQMEAIIWIGSGLRWMKLQRNAERTRE